MKNLKKALVTGGNKGIGYALVKELTQQGYELWLGARNPDLGRKAANDLGVHYLNMDVSEPSTVAEAAKEFGKTHDSLDLLINNAGIFLSGRDGHPSVATLESLKETFDVNFFGVATVTQAFLPFLRKSKSGQIFNISSAMGSHTLLGDASSGLSAWPMLAYSASKSALNTMTILLANELKDTGIRVNCACPGYVGTDLNDHAGTLTPEASAKALMSIILSEDFGTGKFGHVDGIHPW